MEQHELRSFENRCIQEEPAFCKAACPLHIDVRPFLAHMAKGQLESARKVLAKTMPFPDILGRICDQPCKDVCKRKEVGDPIQIGDIERTCIINTEFSDRFLRRPAKEQRIAILCAGFSSMTLAWDLSTKAYAVTLYSLEHDRGGFLQGLGEDRLPKGVLERGFDSLEKRGVTFETVTAYDRAFVEGLLQDYNAVYLGCDSPDAAHVVDFMQLETDEKGLPVYDSVSFATSIPQFFIGGMFENENAFSPVTAASHGRVVCLSIERLIQGASLSASREKEGPYPTRLYTSIEGIAPSAAVPFDSAEGFTSEQAAQEADRCLQCECLECVKVCAYLEHYKGYPKKYARSIYNNISLVHGQRKANTMINSCSYCNLCEVVCPTGANMSEICILARKDMNRQGKMPGSAHDYMLRDFEFNASDAAFLARNEPGTESSAYVFMPGCQLSGSSPQHVQQVYDHLRSQKDVLSGGVGLLLACCGAPAYWAGRPDLVEQHAAFLKNALDALGKPTIIAACPSCLTELARLLPEVSTVSLWEILDKTKVDSMPTTMPQGYPQDVMLHDPCSTRYAPAIQEAARRIFSRLKLNVSEPELTGKYTECCGYGGLMDSANSDMAEKVVERRVSQSDLPFLAYCAMCRDSLSRQGKQVFYALDYVFPESATALGTSPYPLVRAAIGVADRQENRARLKNACLETVWGDAPMTDELDTITLDLSQDVSDLVDSRRILSKDLKRAIVFAESTGKYALNPDTGVRLVSHAPASVTFWVEYTPVEANRFTVTRAWSHRMQLS